MNVVQLNKHEATGGAAVAAKRLHKGLRELGVDSEMLVERTATDHPTVQSRSRLPNGVSSAARFGLDKLLARKEVGFSTGLIPSYVHKQLTARSLDVAHLHWLGDGYLSIGDVANIDIPVVWTLHDMWPVTGGCHYPGDCDRYQDSCGCCPVLGSESGSDLSSRIHRRKARKWSDVPFHFVAPSEWIAEQARATNIFPDVDLTVIPNGLDTDRYRPNPGNETGADSDRTTVLFGAVSATSDPRKGYDLLTEALTELSDPAEYTCIVFGDANPDIGQEKVETESFGFLPENELISLYADCDVMVVPSRQESFGQTALEALSCGTPVVAFDATGPRDIIVHQETGYLAEPYDPVDLGAGIEWVTESDERRERLGRAAREDAIERFDIERIASLHAELYDRIT